MNSALKGIAPLFIAAVIASAVWAPTVSASAWVFHSNTDNPTLTGEQQGSNVDVFTTDSGTVRCSSITYTGSAAGTEQSTIEVAPTYSGCKLVSIINITVDPNGCKYLFHAETRESTSFEGSVDIKCSEGKVIEATFPGCDITVPEQTGLKKVTFTNLGAGHTQEVTIDVNISETITYVEHLTPGNTCENSGTPHTTNGSYTGNALVTGENASKEHIGLSVEVPPTKLHSEVEHTSFTGSQVTTNSYSFGILLGSVKCEVATFDGTTATKTVEEVTLKPAYSKCTGVEREVTTHMNGCAYRVTWTGEATVGKMDIECPGGEVIETTVDAFPGGCTITVGPQSPGGTVDIKGEGSGKTRDLLLTWTVEGIKYKRDGCEVEGESSNGTYTGSATLKGENTSGEQVGIWSE